MSRHTSRHKCLNFYPTALFSAKPFWLSHIAPICFCPTAQSQSAYRRTKAKACNLASPQPFFCIFIIFIFSNSITAQTNKTTEPKFEAFKQVSINQYYTNSNLSQQTLATPPNNYSMGANSNDIIEQNYRLTEERMGMYVDRPYLTKQQNQQARTNYQINKANPNNNNSGYTNKQQQEILSLINEAHSESNNNHFDKSYYKSPEFANETKSFTNAFNTINNMLTGKMPQSISKAYFSVESAYGETYLSEKEYNSQITQSAYFIKQWLIQNGYNPKKNEDLHYGLQKFMKDTLTITIKQPENNQTKTTKHFPFSYDYNDFQAEKDFQNYFITKCIATGTGQCNSLPGTYLAIAEKLGAKTYLSFAPQHSFVKYPDSKGAIHDYEPTSNWKISDKWYVDQMGIKSSAINSGIYLDTLNKKMILANCLLDLAFGYIKKYGATDGKFVTDCINTSMQYYPRKNNITAYFLKSSLLARQLENLLYTNGIKDLKDMGKVQGATELYQELLNNETVIQNLGYQEMPEQMYLEMMQYHYAKGKTQQEQNINTKQKRNLFTTVIK